MLKVSVVVPVKNEGSSIKALLDSLLTQSRVPDEIVITDGGSTDKTISTIEEYSKKNSCIKLICLPHAFPGKGRNTSISHSRYDIIASVDAGCVPERDWLEKLIKPFEEDYETDIVFGSYKPAPKTLLEKCFVTATEPFGYSTSVASLALKKNVWRAADGYPEGLIAGEDTMFKSRLFKGGFKIKYAYDALIYWKPRSTMKDFFKQFYRQARSGGIIGASPNFYIRKMILFFVLFCLIFAGIRLNSYFLLVTFLMYFVWIGMTVIKHYGWFEDIKNKPQTYLVLPVVFIVRDIAQISGFLSGLVRKVRR